MLEITGRLESVPPGVQPTLTLTLPFDLRQKSRLRTRIDGGEDAWLMLPRGEILRGGDLLAAADGRIVEIVSQPERVLHVECDTPEALVRAAYHLGNRHVPVEVREGFLRLAADHVLEQMLIGMGARVTATFAPFEPEAGAYAGHTHGSERGAGRIHEYGKHDEAA